MGVTGRKHGDGHYRAIGLLEQRDLALHCESAQELVELRLDRDGRREERHGLGHDRRDDAVVGAYEGTEMVVHGHAEPVRAVVLCPRLSLRNDAEVGAHRQPAGFRVSTPFSSKA